MGSATLPSACYILSDESSIPFYSTSNGYNYSSIKTVGATVLGGLWALEWAWHSA